MTRLSDRLVLQYVDGAGVVLADVAAGTEIVIPFGEPLERAADALFYFVGITTSTQAGAHRAPETPPEAGSPYGGPQSG